MKPLLDVLVILDALEKEGSFAAASAKLFKTPSALSYTIHRLESDLNIQLLDRSGHRARFTPTGQMLLEKGREVLHVARELEIRAVKLQQGWEHTLRLAVDCTFPVAQLSPLIAAFYQQQPLTRLHFTQNPSLLDWRPLTDGQADLLLGALGGMASNGILGMFLGATLLAIGYRIFMTWVNEGQPALPQDK